MTILDSAEWLRQMRNYTGSGDWLDEANSHDAQFGSTSGADTNDPLYKAHDGGQYLFLPSTVGNYASVSDATPLDMTGDFEFIIKAALDDWTPPSNADDEVLISKWDGTGWMVWMDNLNGLRLVYGDGVTRQASPTTPVVVSNGDWLWIRVTGTVNGSNRDITFYTSTDATFDPDAVSWTQLGDIVVVASNNAIVANTNDVFIGAESASVKTMGGNIAVARAVNDGTVELDVRFADATEPFATFTERSSNAATVTITRTSTGLVSTIIDRNWGLLTTDDYWEIPDDANLDFAGTDDFTVMVMFRTNTVAAGSDVLLSKKDDLTTSAGYALVRNAATGQGIIADGTLDDDDTVATVAIHTLHTLAMVRNTTDDDIEVFLDGVPSGSATADSTTATLANALVQRLGATSGATAANFFEGVIGADVGWRSALTNAEVKEAHDRLTTLGSLPPARRQLVGMIQR